MKRSHLTFYWNSFFKIRIFFSRDQRNRQQLQRPLQHRPSKPRSRPRNRGRDTSCRPLMWDGSWLVHRQWARLWRRWSGSASARWRRSGCWRRRWRRSCRRIRGRWRKRSCWRKRRRLSCWTLSLWRDFSRWSIVLCKIIRLNHKHHFLMCKRPLCQ